MTPVERGRMCQACSRLVMDFRKKSWSEIKAIQEANDNSVCGIYADRQLKYWGQEPPARPIAKWATAAAVSASVLFGGAAEAQHKDSTSTSMIIKGQVWVQDLDGSVGEGAYARVVLENTGFGAISDELGNFEFEVKRDFGKNKMLNITYAGYNPLSLSLDSLIQNQSPQHEGETEKPMVIDLDATLNQEGVQMDVFYVRERRRGFFDRLFKGNKSENQNQDG